VLYCVLENAFFLKKCKGLAVAPGQTVKKVLPKWVAPVSSTWTVCNKRSRVLLGICKGPRRISV